MNPASRKLDHDQQVERDETSQAPDLDGEEVGGRKAFPVGLEERAPSSSFAPLWRRIDSVLLEDLGHGRAGDPVAQISQRTLDSRVAPARRFPGNTNREICDLLRHGWPPCVSPFGAVVPLLGNQSSMPAENRVGRHDRDDLGQHPVSEGSSLRRQATSLGVGQAKPSAPELLLQYSILFAKVLDHGVLFAADPPSDGDDEDLPWTNYSCHGLMMKQSAAIG